MSPEQLIAIQGIDLLDQESQLPGFRALCGLGEHKPFECVGSISESRAAMKNLSKSPEWQNRSVVSTLADFEEIRQSGELELQPNRGAEHCIPATIAAKLDAL